MGKKSRDKGAAWERRVARMFTESLGVPCRRNLEESRSGNSGDIITPGVPLSVQVKCGARPPVYEALKEAIEAARPGDVPVAIVRRNGSGRRSPDDLAVLRLPDFLEFIRALWGPDGVHLARD